MKIPQKEMKIRKIIHVDMDAFFAAVEQRDHPEYRGKPVVVGGSKDGRGVVSTCSYEARKFGIHSAMPASQAYRLCPQAIFVRGNYEAYREASQIVKSIFYEYSDLVEPVSIDEAYIDVTTNKVNIASATIIAQEIRKKIFQKTKLTASAGVSYNKFLAKIASDYNKPNGLKVIEPGQAQKVLLNLKIGKFHGIGKVTTKKMNNMGIQTGQDLIQLELNEMLKYFGKVGLYYYNIVRGIDEREVVISRKRKSVGCERTFPEDVDNKEDLLEKLAYCCEKVADTLKRKKLFGKTITIKMKYANFEVHTRAISIKFKVCASEELYKYAKNIFLKHFSGERKLRLIGMSVSNLTEENSQIGEQLFFPFYLNNRGHYDD